ncbi:MAG: hypothetical protein ACLGI6_19820 [Gammaproteobacteria bacterium]
MFERTPTLPVAGRLERELERERQQRALNREVRSGLSPAEGERLKDPRESLDAVKPRR